MDEDISWKGQWFLWGDRRTIKILDVSLSSICKKNTLDIHRFMVSTRIYIKLRDPKLTLSKTFLLSTAGSVTQTFMIPWFIIVILCSMTQQHESLLLPKSYTQFRRSSPLAQHHRPQRIHSSCCPHSLLNRVKSKVSETFAEWSGLPYMTLPVRSPALITPEQRNC